jgi:hypothetical protein
MPVWLIVPWLQNLAWMKQLPTILKGAYMAGQLLLGMAKNNSKSNLKECSIALERALKDKDTTELEKILLKMRKGESCD